MTIATAMLSPTFFPFWTIFLAIEIVCSSWITREGVISDGVLAQSTSQARHKRQKTALHNNRHESSIRNIILPAFKKSVNPLKSGNHTSNVAILVSSSRYWFNYRHVTNVLSIYDLLKRGGISDENIVLMLADDIPCNMRNPFRGKIFPRGSKDGMGEDLMKNVDIDYAGTDVTVDAFLRVLLGRHLLGEGSTPGLHRRSLPKIDENTNVLVYLTGHGGDNFFKFQDGEELTSMDIASAFSQMYELKRYNEMLFISDTCQAFTMADEIKVPNVFNVGSSLKGQNSYASHTDPEVGQSVIDRYSKIIKDFVDDAVSVTSSSQTGVEGETYGMIPFDNWTINVLERLNLYDALVRIPMTHGDLGQNSQVGHSHDLCSRRMNQVPLSDFFAAPLVERERLVEQYVGKITASLWMKDAPLLDEIESSVYQQDDECESGLGGDRKVNDGDLKQSRHDNDQNQRRGMAPSDHKFLAMLVGLFVCTFHLSRLF